MKTESVTYDIII